MESMFEKVWRFIGDDEVKSIGLYGQGGVGKTTLLEKIKNELHQNITTSTTHGFDIVIYVVLCNTLDDEGIRMEISRRLGLWSGDRTDIFNTLKKKDFVLLLDDIWERVDLQSIGIPSDNQKSKVIFTTPSETVCGLMEADKSLKVECLPWDETWTLFQEKVGNETLDSHPELFELAKIVARDCGGLPLALITIGRAMSTKKTVQEWNYAINSLKKYAAEFPGMSEEVLPLLRLCYDNLHNDTIKSCFLYCALFPEDHSLDKSKLIDYWIGEGFILLDEFSHIDDARKYGYDVIRILESACLLESCINEETGEKEVKMHDTIRDLALWIKKDKMLITRAFEHTSERIWGNVERVYYLRYVDSVDIKMAPPKAPNLQTIIFEDPDSPTTCPIPHNFFQFMPHLRVLDLSGFMMVKFPSSITELLELQYLNLSYTYIDVIPEELRKLVKLRYLDLSKMDYLEKISSGVIGSLLELRVLNLECDISRADWDIEEANNLKYLNDFRIFINTKKNLNKLFSKQNLQKCARHLGLGNLHDGELMNPHYYYIEQQDLGSYFQNLSQIEIFKCNGLKDLTWVGYIGNLKTLDVRCCSELEDVVKVGDDIGGSTGGDEIAARMYNIQDIFKRLEILTVWDLPKLKSICTNTVAFPCLEFINIRECPQLKKLPFDHGSNVNKTLQEIRGEQEWWSELKWEEEGHDNNELESRFLPYFVKYR